MGRSGGRGGGRASAGGRGKLGGKDTSKELQKHFTSQYGARWPKLVEALLKPVQHVAVQNPFCLETDGQRVDSVATGPCAQNGFIPYMQLGPLALFRCPTPHGPYPPPGATGRGVRTWYWLDLASVLPVLLLRPQRGHAVLDMCAAPGGKSLLIAQSMWGEGHAEHHPRPDLSLSGLSLAHAASPTAPVAASGAAPPPPAGPGRLMSNEVDKTRCGRLKGVMEEYLSVEQWPLSEVVCHQGELYWGRQQADTYDRVLVDAPCTSERHVLQQAAARGGTAISSQEWSVAGCKQTANLQLQLCCAAARALRPGGLLVYSTCSLAEEENDGVVRGLMQRHPGALELVPALPALRDALGACGARLLGGPAAAAASAGSGSMGEGEVEGCMAAFGIEATAMGAISLPDSAASGPGPIYLCVMRKVGSVTRPGADLLQAASAGLRPRVDADESSEEEEEEGEGEEGVQDAGAEAGADGCNEEGQEAA